MAARTKRKSQSHIIGEQAFDILKAKLPAYWTVREYKPDYGIDLSVELFEPNPSGEYDTLGEHIFIQLKGSTNLRYKNLPLLPRPNIELTPLRTEQNLSLGPKYVEAIRFSLETTELFTAQRMGAAVPLLLIVVDVEKNRVFFVCLNDYIDKIILPENPAYTDNNKKTLYIPVKNELLANTESWTPLKFYAKRAKLYSAFQKFIYQDNELGYTNNKELMDRVQHFAKILLRYDFWSSCEWWSPIKDAHEHLKNLVAHGSPNLMQYNLKQLSEEELQSRWEDEFCYPEESFSLYDMKRFQETRLLWKELSNLGSIYEEICREWFLPTYLGAACSNLT